MESAREGNWQTRLSLWSGVILMLVLASDFAWHHYQRHAVDEGEKVALPSRVAEHVKLIQETIPSGARVVHLSDANGELVNLATQRKVNMMIYPTLADYRWSRLEVEGIPNNANWVFGSLAFDRKLDC